MKKRIPYFICSHNPGVGCNDASQCFCCGWNPEVERFRKGIIQDEIGKKDQGVAKAVA